MSKYTAIVLEKQSNRTVRTGLGRFAYVHLDEAYAQNPGDKAKFSLTFMFDKTDKQARKVYEEALEAEDVVALSIATRPDCLQPEVVALLEEMNRRKPVFVELGLQTMHEESALRIRRGYPLAVFEDAVQRLSQVGIKVVVHLILGLPYETKEDMLASVRYVCEQPIHGIKLQLLHLLEGTDMGEEYKAMSEEEREKAFSCLEQDAYFDMVVACLKIIPPSVVVHRLTGDGPKKILIAPKWSGNKKAVLNALRKKLGA